MLYTIMNIDYVMNNCGEGRRDAYAPSTNPYDYIRAGYFLDNAALFGGKNNVNYNCNFKRLSSGYRLADADKRIGTQRNIP